MGARGLVSGVVDLGDRVADATQGLGIHGTTNTASLGTRASHGCIRMSIPAVKSLARKVKVGDPVVIF